MESVFSVRIVSADSTINKPLPNLDVCYSTFKQSKVSRVPVIRVFGSTPTGQTTCVNIHGVFPYLMVPYAGPSCGPSDRTAVDQYLQQMGASLDHALSAGSDSGNKYFQQHVYNIVLLRATPFYGYYDNEQLFIKIYFYYPSDIKRASELLQAGAVMNHTFQPHEAHIPYMLQTFMDYNLHGMNLLHCKSCWFRRPVGKATEFMIVPRIAGKVENDHNSVKPQDHSDSKKDAEHTAADLPDNRSISQIFSWNKLRKQDSNIGNIHQVDPKSPQSSISSSLRSTSVPQTGKLCNQSCISLLSRTISGSRADEIMSTFMCEDNQDTLSSPCPLHTVWRADIIPADAYIPVEVASKQTSCEIEVDVIAVDILNRNELATSTGKNPGLASIWADEVARRRARRESSLIEDPKSDETRNIRITEKEENYLNTLKENLPKDLAVTTDDDLDDLKESVSSFLEEPTSRHSMSQQLDSAALDNSSISPLVDMDIVTQVMTPSEQRRKMSKSSSDACDSLLYDLMEMDTAERKLSGSFIGSQRSNGGINEDEKEEEMLDSEESLECAQRGSSALEREESYVMTQPWESGVEDLVIAPDDEEKEVDIPQLDGKSDDAADAGTSSHKKHKSGSQTTSSSATPSDSPVLPFDENETIPNTPPESRASTRKRSLKSLKLQKRSRKHFSSSYDFQQEKQEGAVHIKSSTPKVLKKVKAIALTNKHEDIVVIKAQRGPPSFQQAQEYSNQCAIPSVKDDGEPFYSNPADVQPHSSSRLLITLPVTTKRVKYSSPLQRLEEFSSSQFQCGLQHWRLVSTAVLDEDGTDSGNADNIGMLTKRGFIMNTSVTVGKTTCDSSKITVLKPSLPPPCPSKVWEWIASKKKTPQTKQQNDNQEITDISSTVDSESTIVYDSNQVSVVEMGVDDATDIIPNSPIHTGQESVSCSSKGVAPSAMEDTRLYETVLESNTSGLQQVTSTPFASNNTSKSLLKQAHLPAKRTIFKKTLFKESHFNEANVKVSPANNKNEENKEGNVSSKVSLSQTRKDSTESNASTINLQSLNNNDTDFVSKIAGPFQNSYGFRASQQDLGDSKALHEIQHVTIMSMELHVKTRLDLLPDPEIDEIRAVFYAVQKDSSREHFETGAIIVEKSESDSKRNNVFNMGITNLPTIFVESEPDLFNHFSTLMHRADPDILLGYEVQMLSWGYLFSRATQLGYDLCPSVSRVPSDTRNSWCSAEKDVFGADNMSEIHVVGRLILNLWRLMRTEVALYDYKFESVAYHLLHQRYPRYSPKTLSLWFDQPRGPSRNRFHQNHSRARVVEYYMCRVIGNIKLISQQDLVGRTSELARLFGIQFYEVLTRGSQFRVESMMLRLAHSLNYAAVSPSTMQRAMMKAPECIPLVMEPESRFYAEPVIVVDFQSLYPSIIIAHNYCFSTCLGRVEHLKSLGHTPFGCTSLNIPPKTLSRLLKENGVTVAPNAVAYVKSKVRKGVLPAMLEEILNTRIMVKESMKKCTEKATKQMLDHRQLGLKLIANVTYGYTSANFSGRMACVEIADSVVNKSRETLEQAIRLVNSNYAKREGRVVYGDTDSMFIALKKGTTKQRAFEVAREIVNAVTKSNPPPMKLKFEKVYYPCVLQTKKRYVGYAYESEDQREPIFDAKGIETVRRDGCPAVAKILEQSLKTLFDTRDVSKVKEYVESQWQKILDGKSTLQDCIIAKEYRGMKYYKPGVLVPALVMTRKMVAADKRSEPRIGERVPYVVIHDAPGTPLYQLIRHPKDVLQSPHLRLNGTYYVTKMVLPALDRVMSLLGVNVLLWFQNLPREVKLAHSIIADRELPLEETRNTKKATLSQYFGSRLCLSCKAVTNASICIGCRQVPSKTQECVAKLMNEIRYLERKYHQVSQVCMSCTNSSSSLDIKCESMDCPILYKLIGSQHDLTKTERLRSVLSAYDLLAV